MEVCFRVSDSAARLACFDNEMRRRHATAQQRSAVPAVTATPASAVPAPPAAAPATVAAPAPAPPSLAASFPPAPTPAPKPVVVALTRLLPHPGHIYVFELENGQAWESTDSVSNLFLNPHDLVTIRSGVMGGFFLKTQDGISIRVHRLR
jgi:hypothetical protein